MLNDQLSIEADIFYIAPRCDVVYDVLGNKIIFKAYTDTKLRGR